MMRGGRGMPQGPRPKLDKAVVKRLLKTVFLPYLVPFLFVIVCIVVSAVANVRGSLFFKNPDRRLHRSDDRRQNRPV